MLFESHFYRIKNLNIKNKFSRNHDGETEIHHAFTLESFSHSAFTRVRITGVRKQRKIEMNNDKMNVHLQRLCLFRLIETLVVNFEFILC